MSMLDALDEDMLKPRRERKNKTREKKEVKKEPKPKTWEVSFGLYQQGMKPEEIARERGLTTGTIVGHLARYVPSGAVRLNDLIDPERQQAIERVVRMVGTSESTTAIKALCPPEVTYDDIRLVLSLTQQ
jgi:uncharacterized protein YpbB